MEKCKSCVYWGGVNTTLSVKKALCEAIDDVSGDFAYIDIVVSDDSGLRTRFLTSPEFGCSLHKPKEDGK